MLECGLPFLFLWNKFSVLWNKFWSRLHDKEKNCGSSDSVSRESCFCVHVLAIMCTLKESANVTHTNMCVSHVYESLCVH